MQRTQISLTEETRRLLDEEAVRTGRSLSSLIRAAVERTYGSDRDESADLAAIQAATGGWQDRDFDGEQYVESLRSGARLAEALDR